MARVCQASDQSTPTATSSQAAINFTTPRSPIGRAPWQPCCQDAIHTVSYGCVNAMPQYQLGTSHSGRPGLHWQWSLHCVAHSLRLGTALCWKFHHIRHEVVWAGLISVGIRCPQLPSKHPLRLRSLEAPTVQLASADLCGCILAAGAGLFQQQERSRNITASQ